jgi:hypothetical protein
MTDDRDPGMRATGPIRFDAAVGGASRAPAIALSLIIVFVAVAFAKPWERLAPTSPGSTTDGPATAAVEVPRDREPVVPAPSGGQQAVRAMCLDPGSWRTTTIEQWQTDQTVRVWRAVELRTATGPTDPGIDVVPAVGEIVPAIGYCAPVKGPDRPGGPAELAAWRVDGDIATPIDLRQVAPARVVSEFGALFGPPDRGPGWPAGVYVFRRIDLASGSEAALWFAVEVRTAHRTGAIGPEPIPSHVAVIETGGGGAAWATP